jgi:hypothetical protein
MPDVALLPHDAIEADAFWQIAPPCAFVPMVELMAIKTVNPVFGRHPQKTVLILLYLENVPLGEAILNAKILHPQQVVLGTKQANVQDGQNGKNSLFCIQGNFWVKIEKGANYENRIQRKVGQTHQNS